MNLKPMEQQLRSEVLRRLQDQYGLKPRAGTQYLPKLWQERAVLTAG